jgi:hypothetical protein
VRSYQELIAVEPAWPEIAARAEQAPGRVEILPRAAEAAREILESLQITLHSPLGAVAHETGGILVDQGWVRLLGSGHSRLRRTLRRWNEVIHVPLRSFLVVGDDAVGGVFAVNAGALGPSISNVHYFAPDTLRWIDLGRRYGDFLDWLMTGDLATFYASLRWPGWADEILALHADTTLHLYPPPWSLEGKDVAKVSRRAVPAHEMWQLQVSVASQLA